jgi:Holliday junction resolvase
MAKINSRDKGKRGEREFAAFCREHGYDCRRGQQYSGIEGEDVVGLPGVHIEVKRVEKLNLYDAMDQARRDAADGTLPIVAHRRNRSDWLVVMRAEDWFGLFREWEAGRSMKGGGA